MRNWEGRGRTAQHSNGTTAYAVMPTLTHCTVTTVLLSCQIQCIPYQTLVQSQMKYLKLENKRCCKTNSQSTKPVWRSNHMEERYLHGETTL